MITFPAEWWWTRLEESCTPVYGVCNPITVHSFALAVTITRAHVIYLCVMDLWASLQGYKTTVLSLLTQPFGYIWCSAFMVFLLMGTDTGNGNRLVWCGRVACVCSVVCIFRMRDGKWHRIAFTIWLKLYFDTIVCLKGSREHSKVLLRSLNNTCLITRTLYEMCWKSDAGTETLKYIHPCNVKRAHRCDSEIVIIVSTIWILSDLKSERYMAAFSVKCGTRVTGLRTNTSDSFIIPPRTLTCRNILIISDSGDADRWVSSCHVRYYKFVGEEERERARERTLFPVIRQIICYEGGRRECGHMQRDI